MILGLPEQGDSGIILGNRNFQPDQISNFKDHTLCLY